jgi:hypothetical protein
VLLGKSLKKWAIEITLKRRKNKQKNLRVIMRKKRTMKRKKEK